jgi:hypothetical protein
MDDVLAVMPRAERMMVEKELGLIGSGTGTVTGIEREMSWELLNLSVHTNINDTTPSRTRPRPSANTGTGTGVNGHASPPIIPHHFPQISAPVFINNVTPRRTAPRMSLGMAGRAIPATSTSIPTIPLSATGTGAGVGVGATIPMFESANRTRNVFYDPPPISHQNNTSNVGWKRSFQHISDPEPAFDQSRKLVDSVDDDDMGMGAEMQDDGNLENESDEMETTRMKLVDEERDQLSYSVFSQPMKRTETQMKMPPGAFFEESDDERERERERVTRRRAPPPSSRQTRASRVAQQHQHQVQDPGQERQRQEPTNFSSSGRRLPGALIEDEDEEADDIAPLPSPPALTRARKGRSRGSSTAEQPLRRSSRLSATPSAASSSPEPEVKKVSSKPRKRTRTATKGVGMRKRQ